MCVATLLTLYLLLIHEHYQLMLFREDGRRGEKVPFGTTDIRNALHRRADAGVALSPPVAPHPTPRYTAPQAILYSPHTSQYSLSMEVDDDHAAAHRRAAVHLRCRRGGARRPARRAGAPGDRADRARPRHGRND